MNPDRFARLKEIALTAARLPAGERPAYLAEACGGDESLRTEAERLIAQDERDTTSAKSGLGSSLPDTVVETEGSRVESAPDHVGPYRIVGVLGQGGMGIVYHARQSEPISREVALKVVSGGLVSGSSRARFEAERQTLASMDHPNIARVYDAGADEEGRPYFVMELVRGVPITQYCREEALGVRARVELFAEICRAVRHAHQKGIIHRDLKPSNVLVTKTQERAQVKVIDFGIAKALGEDLLAASHRTRTGQLVGTVEYMSPEQARGEVSSIDVRSDVFSLGVIAYELLADRLPFDVEGQPLHEAVRRICEQPEKRLRGKPTATTGRIDADLETIVAKCLSKEPDHRYGSAAELAEDLERYLGDLPVHARPATTLYQMRLFAKRHKALCGAAAAVFVVLLGASIVSTLMYLRTERARVEASRERDASRAVTGFLQWMLASASPRQSRGREVTVREVLDRATTAFEKDFAGPDEVKASIQLALGATYRSLGDLKNAETQLLASLAERRRLYGDEHPDTLDTLAEVVYLKWYQGNFAEAERMQRQIVESLRKTLGNENPRVLDSMNQRGLILRDVGRNVEALQLFRELVALDRRVKGPDDEGTLAAQYQLATLLEKLGFASEAEQLHRQTLEARTRLFGEDHPDTLWSMVLLGFTLSRDGRHAEAEPIVRRACELHDRVNGPNHPDALWCRNVMGEVLRGLGRTAEARALLEPLLETRRRALGSEHRDTLWSMTSLGRVYSDLGMHVEAEALLRESLSTRTRILGEDHWDTAWSRAILAEVLGVAGRIEEAEALLRRNLEARTIDDRGGDVRQLEVSARLGEAMRAQGKFGAAEALVIDWHDRLSADPDVAPAVRRRAIEIVVRHYEAWAQAEPGRGNEARAAAWRAKLDDANATAVR